MSDSVPTTRDQELPPPETMRSKYGPWALIVGASHGMGAAFAKRLAGFGLNCVLVARRADALHALGDELIRLYGVEVQVITQDLSEANAGVAIADALAEREVGLVIYNAGAPSKTASEFLDAPLDYWLAHIRQNNSSLTEICYRMGKPMVERGHGGLLLVGSHAALGGNKKYALYTGTKGFMANFGESLWTEWEPKGIDVLNFLIQVVDSPSLRQQMRASNLPGADADADDLGVPRPETLVDLALQQLSHGPTYIHPDDLATPAGTPTKGQLRREELVERVRITSAFV